MDQIERKLTHDIKKINREICCIREAIGSGTGYSGIVDNFIDLPLASAHANELYYVINTSTGSIGNSYYSNGLTWVSSLTLFDTRITILENNVYKVTYYEIVSGTSGSLTTTTGTTINSGEFGNSGNSILSKINGSNKPTFESPRDSGGNVVTSTLNVGTGAWVASGTYTDATVALIYSVNINAEDFSNLNNFYIVESEQIDTPYTFSTGLTKSVTDVVTANLSTGITGGQSAIGGINASENLTLSSTAHATKGKILFGTSAYDEVNNRFGIGNQSPIYLGQFDCTDSTGSTTKSTVTAWNTNTSGTGVFSGFRVRVGSGEDGGSFIGSRYALNTFGIANGITLKTNVATQDIGFTTGAASIGGTGTGPQWLLKADGSLEHHFNLTKYVSYTVDTSSNLTIGLNGGSGSRLRITNYGTGAITGTPTYNIVTDASGNFIETALTSGATLTSTYVGVGNGSNLLSGSANLTYASGLFTVLGTTQQAKFAYNASNHLGITISSVGHAQLTLTGTSPTFRINNAVSINTSAQPTSVLDVKYTSGGIDTLKLTDTGNWIISFYQGATQRAGFDNYGRTWNTLGGNAVFNSGTGTIAFNQNSVSVLMSTGTGAVVGTLQLVTGFVGVGVAPLAKLHSEATTEQFRASYNSTNYASFTTASNGDLTIALTGTTPTVKFSTKVQFSDVDLVLGTTTGTKIGTLSTQKLALWGKTPIVQPTTAIARTGHTSVGGTVINDNDTFGGYTLDQAITALINCGILA